MRKIFLASPLVLAAGSAFAAVPTEVTDALATSKTDVATIATAVLLIVFTIATFAYMKRAK